MRGINRRGGSRADRGRGIGSFRPVLHTEDDDNMHREPCTSVEIDASSPSTTRSLLSSALTVVSSTVPTSGAPIVDAGGPSATLTLSSDTLSCDCQNKRPVITTVNNKY